MNTSVQGNKSKHTRGKKKERFLIWTTQNTANFLQLLPSTNRQTDIKHEMGKTLGLMSLLKFVGEKLPPSQRIEFGNLEFGSFISRFDLCEGGSFSCTIFKSDIKLSLYHISCLSVCLLHIVVSNPF